MTTAMTDISHPPKKWRKNNKQNKSKVQMMYLAQMTVQEGLDLIHDVFENHRGLEKLKVMGEIVKRDFARFTVLTSCVLKCYKCGVEATHFQIEKHRNDRVMPFSLNVYSGKRMLTWDHIVPKSYEGGDDPLNGRCACKSCNENRGNEMTMQEMVWAATQNPLQIYKEKQKTEQTISELVGTARREFHELARVEEVSL